MNEEVAMRIIKHQQLKDMVGLSRTTIWRMEREGKFPSRVRLGANTVGWLEEEVLSWLASRPRGMTASAGV